MPDLLAFRKDMMITEAEQRQAIRTSSGFWMVTHEQGTYMVTDWNLDGRLLRKQPASGRDVAQWTLRSAL